jgi:hypothetical protein
MAADPQARLVLVTKELQNLGLTDKQLKSIKFTGKHQDNPIDEWPMTWDRSVQVSSSSQIASLMRQYAVLEFALVKGPAENNPQLSQAFRQISEYEVEELAFEGLKYFDRQQNAAQARRGFIKDEMTMRDFVNEFALFGENRLLTAKQLWKAFPAHFRFEAGLDATMKNNSLDYLDGRTLHFVTFRNYVRIARKTTSH